MRLSWINGILELGYKLLVLHCTVQAAVACLLRLENREARFHANYENSASLDSFSLVNVDSQDC